VRTRGLKVHGVAHRFGTFNIYRQTLPGQPEWQTLASGDNHWGDTEWTRISLRLQALAYGGKACIHVEVSSSGRATGTALFDGLKLVEESAPAK
jgi:hypothetical protein